VRLAFAKIGASCYFAWGVLHVVGGAVLLAAAVGGVDSFLRAQTGLEGLAWPASSAVASSAARGVFAFHAFNLTWLGLLAALIAVRLNWRNAATGYWLNLAVVGFTDLGLVLFIVRPGILDWSSAWIGPALLVPAAVLSTFARRGEAGGGPLAAT